MNIKTTTNSFKIIIVKIVLINLLASVKAKERTIDVIEIRESKKNGGESTHLDQSDSLNELLQQIDADNKPLTRIIPGTHVETSNDFAKVRNKSKNPRDKYLKVRHNDGLVKDVLDLFSAVNKNARANGYRDSDIGLLKQVANLYKLVKDNEAKSYLYPKTNRGYKNLKDLIYSHRTKTKY